MTDNNTHLVEKLAALGWGSFFVWIGVAYIFKFSIGVALLGIGLNTLFWQLMRKNFNLKLEGFWIVVGCFFLLGGIGHLFDVDIPLIPIVLIAAGVFVFYGAITKKKS